MSTLHATNQAVDAALAALQRNRALHMDQLVAAYAAAPHNQLLETAVARRSIVNDRKLVFDAADRVAHQKQLTAALGRNAAVLQNGSGVIPDKSAAALNQLIRCQHHANQLLQVFNQRLARDTQTHTAELAAATSAPAPITPHFQNVEAAQLWQELE